MNTTSLRKNRPSLSQELIDITLGMLRDDQEALRQCCLASRSCQVPAQKILFECIKLKPITPPAAKPLPEAQPESVPGPTTTSTPSTTSPTATTTATTTTTMSQRLYTTLSSSPHLAGLIKDLRIRDEDDYNPSQHTSTSWLKDDTSLPQILPLLKNLQRIFLAGSMSDSMLDISSLPGRMRNALFDVWRQGGQSGKITHIGFQCVKFSSFEELLEVVEGCVAVKHLTFFAVDVDELEGASTTANDVESEFQVKGSVNTQRPGNTASGDLETSSGTKQINRTIESLGLFLEPDLLSRFCTWLLGPNSNVALSSLKKLSLVAELKDNLKSVRQVVQASSALQEMRITIISGDDTSQTEPFDISSLRIIHLGIDFEINDPSECLETTLNWWCDNLTSSPSSALSLTEFNIYILTYYDSIPDIEYHHPGWKRLDEILSSLNGQDRTVQLTVQIKCLEDDDDFGDGYQSGLESERETKPIPLGELKKLEDVFPRMRDRGWIKVGQMKESLFTHLGVYWAQ